MRMRPPAMLLLAWVAACGAPRQQSAFFSFEGSLQGWTAYGLDTSAGGVEENWSILPTFDSGFDGPGSARLFMDDRTGASEIWLERTFALAPPGRYRAHLEFALTATGDLQPADGIVAGVLPRPPRNRDELQPAVQGYNTVGRSGAVTWDGHAYDFDVQGASATVVVGLWSGSRGAKSYYLDAVEVLFSAEP
jgi:hypothetical protein